MIGRPEEFAVHEEIRIPAGRPALWLALTGASGLRHWWGAADHDLDTVAQEVTVRTGSSSLHRLWVERVEPPRRLDLTGSYLGVTRPHHIRIDIGEEGTVSVREFLTDPPPALTHLTRELWRYRLGRLATLFRESGPDPEPDRLTLSRTLQTPRWRPLHRQNLPAWLPITDLGLPPRSFYVIDTVGARAFPVTGWQTHYDERLSIEITVNPNYPATRAALQVNSTAVGDLRLDLCHSGWVTAGPDAETRQMLRTIFLATWRAALETGGGVSR